ncbi:MAG: hypothetical protein N2449_03205 [Bacteroidales bacterium]|nr:hypothetical protein [Bacteroidales bacterium]
MKHFIEDAEEREKNLKQQISSSVQKQTEIQKENIKLYEPFHQEMVKLINKIASLSSESRKPVVEIGHTHLEGENKYEYYASSYKTLQIRKLLFFKKERIYSWWRRIIIEMTDIQGIVVIKLHEKGTSESNIADVIKKKLKTKTNINNLNQKTAIILLDYLGYRISAHDLLKHFE